MKSNLIEASSWITTSLPSELKEQQAWVEGDAVQLQIAVINLVKNAVDALSHQPPTTVAPEIAIRLERREQHWAIVVDDTVPDCLTTTPVTCRFTAASLPAAHCSSCARRWRATTEN